MSIKATIGRRIFAKSLPAVPFAAAQTSGMLMNQAAERRRAFPKCGAVDSSAPEIDPSREIKRKKLDAARTFLNENRRGQYIDYFRRRKNDFTTLDPNITALRSVSDQHKIHMHIAAEEKLDEEHQSWQDSILKMFGLDNKRDRYDLF